MDEICSRTEISQRQACLLVDQPPSSQSYRAKPVVDRQQLKELMVEILRKSPRYGYRRLYRELRAAGVKVNTNWYSACTRRWTCRCLVGTRTREAPAGQLA